MPATWALQPYVYLVEPYEDIADGPIFHFDLYRLGDAQELDYLGWATTCLPAERF